MDIIMFLPHSLQATNVMLKMCEALFELSSVDKLAMLPDPSGSLSMMLVLSSIVQLTWK